MPDAPAVPGVQAPGGGPQPGQPPMGASPATGPTQNLGAAAQGIQAVGALLKGMAMVLTLVGPATPIGMAITKALQDIGKHVPPGASTPQGENNFAKQMMLRQQQMGSHQAAMGAQQPAPQPPSAPAAAA